jgi:hypothetical protein
MDIGLRVWYCFLEMPDTANPEKPAALESPENDLPATNKSWLVLWSSFVFALVQSFCTAVIAVSGIRVVIGLSALAAAAGIHGPARGFHQDAIRIPMMLLALAGALLNLYVLWHVRRLRNRPSAQWRQRPLSPAKRRSEKLQFALSILTLLLLLAEWITHPMIHRV